VLRRRFAYALVVAIGLAMPGAASADETETAGALYDHAVEAQKRGDYAKAANLFARADELVPDAAALEAAIGAAILADDAPLAMALVKRSGRGPISKSLAAVVRSAQSKFADRVGMVRIRCSRCTARIDGASAKPGEERWVAVGSHSVQLGIDDRLERHTVTVRAGEVTEVAPDGSPPPEPSTHTVKAPPGGEHPEPPRAGIAPVWFWTGAGLTVVMGAFAIVSGADTLNKHAEFEVKKKENPNATELLNKLSTDGGAADTRTQVLVGVTVGLAITTAVVGAVFVRWDSPGAKVSGGVSVGPTGVTGTFRF